MQKVMIPFIMLTLCVFTACGTPVQLRQLSRAQLNYFEIATQAVASQSEALIIAAESIKQGAEARIDSQAAENISRLQQALNPENLNEEMTEEQRNQVTSQLFQRAQSTAENALQSKLRLAADLQSIKDKSDELQSYIDNMKEVQEALDAYMQSEEFGEKFLNESINHPSVTSLIGRVNEAGERVRGTTESLQLLLSNLGTGRP